MSEIYRRAGVDLEAAAEAVALIGDVASRATRPEVRGGVGGFAGLFDLGGGRLLAAATDGVGTKTEVARRLGRYDTVGIDLVAMCADDVACTGARPLVVLDYLATGQVVPERVGKIVEGVAEGCRRAGCALLGGETAEHPGVVPADAFDLAGFCAGVVDESSLLGPDRVRQGDALIGLASSGLHANGYSLVRRAVLDEGAASLEAPLAGLGRSLGEELLEPSAIYAPLLVDLASDGLVAAAAHITGGGLPENLPRALPEGAAAEVRLGSWPVPPLFAVVRDLTQASDDDMLQIFNMGIGMALVVRPTDAARVIGAAREAGTAAFHIGSVVAGSGVRFVAA